MTTLLVALIIGFSFTVHIAFGFGGALMALPLLSLIIGVKNSITLILVFQTLAGLQLFWIHKHIAFGKLKLFIAATVAGVITGVFFFSRLDDRLLEIFLGAYLILYVLAEFLGRRAAKQIPATTPTGAVLYGFCGGIISGAIGTGGPLLITYLKQRNLGKESLRATMIFLLLFSNLIRVALTLQMTAIPHEVVVYAAWALPAFLAALYIGNRVMKKLAEKHFHTVIDVLLLASGAALLLRQL